MTRETYIPDPVLHSTARIAEDDSGEWYAFLADGAELVDDSIEQLAAQIARHWARILENNAKTA